MVNVIKKIDKMINAHKSLKSSNSRDDVIFCLSEVKKVVEAEAETITTETFRIISKLKKSKWSN